MTRELGDECIDEAAKTLGVSREEAEASFEAWMKETFPETWEEGLDDEDYNHFADMWYLAVSPRTSSGGSGGEEWVGMFIGFDRRFDMMKRKREMVIDVATANLSGAIANGFTYNGNKVGIGRAFIQNGVWNVEHSTGTYVSKDPVDGGSPDWVITLNEKLSVAMLKADNTPQKAYSVKSLWAFHGNTKEKFLLEGPRLVTAEGAWEAATHDWSLWQPITVRGKFDEEGWNGAGPTLSISNANATYGLDWVTDKKKLEAAEALFNPQQYLTTVNTGVNLKDLLDYHLDNRRESYIDKNGVQRYDGPCVVIVGGVMDINHEGREAQWDPTGRDYWLSISSQLLRRENPNSRVGIKVSGVLHDDFNALSVLKNGEWLPFARGSRIWVVGRTNSYTNQDGDEVVNVDAQGIYAIPNKSICAEIPSEGSNDLDNLSGFGIGGDE